MSKIIYKKISDNLKKKIGRNFIVSFMPDHPLIMDAPEIIIGGQGKLTCLITDYDYKSADKLRSKLKLCRLALPENARLILSTESNKISDELSKDFDRILEPSEVENYLFNFVDSNDPPKTDIKQIKESKKKHHNLYSKLFFINQKRSTHFNSSSKIFNIYDKLRNEKNISWAEQISSLRLSKSHTKRQITSHCLDAIKEIVDLDNGTPYLNSENFYRVILSDFLPVSRIDPEKPLRALAFSAQAITDAESSSELEEIISRIDDLVNKKRTWEIF